MLGEWKIVRTNSSFKIIHCLLLVFLFNLQGCAPHDYAIVPPSGIEPFLYDDGDLISLQLALDHHRTHLNAANQISTAQFTGKMVQTQDFAKAIQKFNEIMVTYTQPFDRNRALKENFSIYQAKGRRNRNKGEMLVTGYFEPVLSGSLVKKPPYLYPLYAPPPNLQKYVNASGTTEIGRNDENGNFVPYWTRAEIETTDVIAGNELVFLKDPFDAFLLHIQGSGKIELQDGRTRSIQYRSNNGHVYSSIGKLLVDEKKMALKDVDIPALRRYLTANPQDLIRILHYNKRYIFFGWGDEENPRGSIGAPLTPGRSIAVDSGVLPMNAIGYLISRKPIINDNGKIVSWTTLHRFVLPQDTGSAIKGPGRVDFYWGKGNYAEIAAGTMKEEGKLYFLINKEENGNSS